MPQTHEQWEQTMIKNFGSVEAGKEEMKRRRSLAGKPTKPGGFAYLKEHDPKRFKELQEQIKETKRRNYANRAKRPNSN